MTLHTERPETDFEYAARLKRENAAKAARAKAAATQAEKDRAELVKLEAKLKKLKQKLGN